MNQNEQVLEHLKKHGAITARYAWRQYGIARLAARIYTLRSKGHRIETETLSQKAPKTGTYARYRYYSKGERQ